MMGVSVFISYATSDKPFAEKVAESLSRTGIAVLSDELPRGTKFTEALRAKLEQSDGAVFIASDASENSAHVMFELGAFRAADKPVVAVQSDGADAPSPNSPFSLVRTIDARTKSWPELVDWVRRSLETNP